MELRLANGLTVSGTPEEMSLFVNANTTHEASKTPFMWGSPHRWGDDPSVPAIAKHYDSTSKGIILIAEMNTLHIKNALLKMGRDEDTTLRHREYVGLIQELVTRLYAYEDEKKEE